MHRRALPVALQAFNDTNARPSLSSRDDAHDVHVDLHDHKGDHTQRGNRTDELDDEAVRRRRRRQERVWASAKENNDPEYYHAVKVMTPTVGTRVGAKDDRGERAPLSPLGTTSRLTTETTRVPTPLRRARSLVEQSVGVDLYYLDERRDADGQGSGAGGDAEARAAESAQLTSTSTSRHREREREREREMIAFMKDLAATADAQKSEIEDLLDALAASEIDAEERAKALETERERERDALEYAVLLESRERAKAHDRAVELETLLTVKTAEIEKLRAELSSRALDIEPRPERRATPSNAAKRAVSNLRAEIRAVIENDIRAELAAALVRGQ